MEFSCEVRVLKSARKMETDLGISKTYIWKVQIIISPQSHLSVSDTALLDTASLDKEVGSELIWSWCL